MPKLKVFLIPLKKGSAPDKKNHGHAYALSFFLGSKKISNTCMSIYTPISIEVEAAQNWKE